MKNFTFVLMFMFLFLSFVQEPLPQIHIKPTTQKMIKIDEQLKNNSQSMIVKRKGISVVGKYEFGPYKVISGKSGWEKVSTRSPLFGDHTSINSSSKMSYVFVNNEADTCFANIRVVKNIETDDGNWFSRTFLNWTDSEIKKGEGVFETVFTFSADTIQWRLIVVYPLAIEQNGTIKMDTNTKFHGILTDSKIFIEIKQVTEREDGKSSLLSPVLGYEFWQDSKSLAAVQVIPVNRMYVWLRDDLEAPLKFVLANGASAMLIKNF